MLTLKNTTMAAALLASFGFTGMAKATVIDAFNEGLGVVAADVAPVGGGAVSATEGNAAWTGVIGNARDLSSEMTVSLNANSTVTTFVSGGFFQSNRTASTQGVSKVHWDGAADGVLSTSGLGGAAGVDLILGGGTQFILVVASDNKGGAIDLTLWDTPDQGGDMSTKSFNSSGAGTYTLDFTDFSPLIDFRHIAAIELSVSTGINRILTIDSLSTNATPGVPEPATLALLGLGLAGLGWSKRSRAA